MKWEDVGKLISEAAPLLGSVVGSVVPGIGTVAGGAAGSALSGVIASAFGVDNTPDAVAQAIKADPQAAIKLRQIELDHEKDLRTAAIAYDTAVIQQVNETARKEQDSEDTYVKRARPTALYSITICATAAILACVYTIITDPQQSVAVIAAVASLWTIFTPLMCVGGLYVWKRSSDKQLAAGQAPTGNLATTLVNAFKGNDNK